MEHLLKIADAAKAAGIPVSRIYKWHHTGKLKFTKQSHKAARVDISDICKLLPGKRTASATAKKQAVFVPDTIGEQIKAMQMLFGLFAEYYSAIAEGLAATNAVFSIETMQALEAEAAYIAEHLSTEDTQRTIVKLAKAGIIPDELACNLLPEP